MYLYKLLTITNIEHRQKVPTCVFPTHRTHPILFNVLESNGNSSNIPSAWELPIFIATWNRWWNKIRATTANSAKRFVVYVASHIVSGRAKRKAGRRKKSTDQVKMVLCIRRSNNNSHSKRTTAMRYCVSTQQTRTCAIWWNGRDIVSCSSHSLRSILVQPHVCEHFYPSFARQFSFFLAKSNRNSRICSMASVLI